MLKCSSYKHYFVESVHSVLGKVNEFNKAHKGLADGRQSQRIYCSKYDLDNFYQKSATGRCIASFGLCGEVKTWSTGEGALYCSEEEDL